MSKAKWFVVRNPSTGEIVATSGNQIVPLKFHRGTKLYYIHHSHGHITHDVMIYLSCSMVQCSMDTLKFVCTWHGGISGAKLSVKVCSGKICNVARQSELYYRALFFTSEMKTPC